MTPELPPPSAAPELRLMNNARRIRDTGLAILVWIVLIGVFFWGLAHIAGPVLMFALGAIIAYALTPLVGRLGRVMPRWLALIIVYLGLLVVIAAAIFLLVVAVFQEFGPLVDQINKWLTVAGRQWGSRHHRLPEEPWPHPGSDQQPDRRSGQLPQRLRG